jgi:DNA sulfur modification protein DndE
MKSRTGLTPNILCRIGLCYSLLDESKPNLEEHQDDGMEFNRYTLTGEWDDLFISLFNFRCYLDQIPEDEELRLKLLRAHVNRGVLQIYNRVRNISDLENLIPQELKVD